MIGSIVFAQTVQIWFEYGLNMSYFTLLLSCSYTQVGANPVMTVGNIRVSSITIQQHLKMLYGLQVVKKCMARTT